MKHPKNQRGHQSDISDNSRVSELYPRKEQTQHTALILRGLSGRGPKVQSETPDIRKVLGTEFHGILKLGRNLEIFWFTNSTLLSGKQVKGNLVT